MDSICSFTPPAALASAYHLAEGQLQELSGLIENRLRHDNPFLEEVFGYGFRLGGKRLRPLLVFLSGKAVGEVKEDHLRAAAALEMIHTGTLIHDDILDGANIRRHLQTLNIRWDPRTAVLAGDCLLTQAIHLTTEIDDTTCYRSVALACRKTCEGELLQTALQGEFGMTEDDYYRVIRGKTASLLECSARLGAYFGGASAKCVERFAFYGQGLGMAFQILDDLLDLEGETESMGKTLGTDLINRKPTLPLILFLANAGAAERERVLSLLNKDNPTSEDLAAVTGSLRDAGCLTAARRQAERFVADALASLDKTCPVMMTAEQTDAYAALESVANFVLSRNC
ncbi:MAG: polyprenyl synthetase family protein [Thermoguttaceae bacterium]|nr:polyprenyl synthetase family protein [Thermoguttaceae bacterium]